MIEFEEQRLKLEGFRKEVALSGIPLGHGIIERPHPHAHQVVIEAGLPENILAGIRSPTHTNAEQAISKEVLTATNRTSYEQGMPITRMSVIGVTVGISPSRHEALALNIVREKTLHKSGNPRESIAPGMPLR